MRGFFVDKIHIIDIIKENFQETIMNLINRKTQLMEQMCISAFDKKGRQIDALWKQVC